MQIVYVFSLHFYASPLIALLRSENTSMNGGSDEAGSLIHESRTSSSPPRLSFSSNSESMHEKSLKGLRYLNNNADNLLGYLKTVSPYLTQSKATSDVVDEYTRRRIREPRSKGDAYEKLHAYGRDHRTAQKSTLSHSHR